jgi:hypothetical protein
MMASSLVMFNAPHQGRVVGALAQAVLQHLVFVIYRSTSLIVQHQTNLNALQTVTALVTILYHHVVRWRVLPKNAKRWLMNLVLPVGHQLASVMLQRFVTEFPLIALRMYMHPTQPFAVRQLASVMLQKFVTEFLLIVLRMYMHPTQPFAVRQLTSATSLKCVPGLTCHALRMCDTHMVAASSVVGHATFVLYSLKTC